MANGFPRKHWVSATVDGDHAAVLARELDLALPIAAVLTSRGFHTPELAEPFLNPRLSDLSDPFLLTDMDAAVDCVWAAIDNNRSMLVFGDYDVDGVCAATLVASVLRALGGRADVFLPNRLEDGYGFSLGAFERKAAAGGYGLIITVDCGTGSTEAVTAARAAGMDVIVTDHHELEGTAAPATALINPKMRGETHAAELAGVGVAFKLCHGIVKRGLREAREAARRVDLREYLDLVAIATVADVVPLVGENRILVSHGLQRINVSPRVGVRALMDVAGLRRQTVDCYHIGFVLGPRLNAAGRLGGAEAAINLLMTDSREVAMAHAQTLEAANRERKQIEAGILAAAQQELDARVTAGEVYGLVVGQAGWHIGTVGIVASRLVSRYARPTVVIGFDENGRGRGSCRSIDALDVLEALRDCESHLKKFGGHRMAAGIEITQAAFEGFRAAFEKACRLRLEGRDLRPVQVVDAWIGLGEADERLLAGLDRLRPLGTGNPSPTWGVRNVRLAGAPRRIGRDARHLKFAVAKGGSQMETIGFNLGEHALPDGELDMVFQLRPAWFGGGVELNMVDLRASA